MSRDQEAFWLGHRYLAGNLSRRDFLRSAAVLGLSAAGISTLLAACSSEDTPSTTAATPSTTAAVSGTTATTGPEPTVATPAAKKTLVVAVAEPPPTLDEEFGGGPAFRSLVPLQDGLLEFGDHAEPEIGPGALDLNWGSRDMNELVRPLMAESFTVSLDKKVYTFRLRQGLISHAGNEFTAEDVKWRFDRAFGLASIGTFFTNVSRLEGSDSVKVIDRYTVEFTLKEPTPNFLLSLANDLRITIPDSVEAKKHATSDDPWATEWFKSNYVGFGNYRLESLNPDTEMVAVAHEDHPTPPKADRLVFRFVPDSASRLALLSQGEVDAILGFTPSELATLAATEGVHVWNFPGNARLAVPMIFDFPPLDNRLVRQALSYAVPYEGIVEQVFQGFALPARGPLVRKDAGFEAQDFPYTLDLEKAKDLLGQAGLPGGFETSYAYNSGDPNAELVGVQLQTSFAEIGVDLELNALTSAAYSETLSKAQSPLIYWALGADQPDPAYVAQVWFDPDAPTNWSAYSNPGMRSLIDQGLKIPEWGERVTHFEDVIQTIIDDAAWLFIAELGFQVATGDDVRGLRWDMGHIDWHTVDVVSG